MQQAMLFIPLVKKDQMHVLGTVCLTVPLCTPLVRIT